MLYACRKGVVDGCTGGSENNGRMRAIIAYTRRAYLTEILGHRQYLCRIWALGL